MFTLSISGSALAGGMHMQSSEGMGHMENAGGMENHNSHWVSPEGAAQRINPIKRDVSSITRGASLFAENCASCHGQNATGDGPAGMALNPRPANLRKMSGQHPDGDFAWKIANGRGAMPAWKKTLGEDQIWDLTNYIQSLSVTEKSQDDGVAEQMKALSDEDHGHGGDT